MFTPPCCPYRGCVQHRSPDPSFFTRHGSYRAKCRPHPVPRFRCKSCRRTFSRQTFRMDYRDHKPHCKRRYLDLALQLHMTFRNLIRFRFNYDRESAAQLLGFAPRRLRPTEALSWRQDWGEWSPDPFSASGRTHRDRLAAAA